MKNAHPRRRFAAPAAGMTLVEIMVVVLIMGMIAAIVAKVVVDRIQIAKVEIAKTQMREMMDALDHFCLDNGFYPTTEQMLQALVDKPTTGRVPDKWPEHGYLKTLPLDPWGNAYVYVSPASVGDFDIVCLGRDGKEGGDGYDADIRSSEFGKAPAGK